ncbi:MAG: type II toxin-antitoxin system RelE/ParE family toxin [Casimicrobiaceae bacterium]
MYEIKQTEFFVEWLSGLRDGRARARIVARLKSARFGNLGDIRSVGDGVSEMRVDFGPGYRIYFTRRKTVVIILLCAGDKSTQIRDVERAKSVAAFID